MIVKHHLQTKTLGPRAAQLIIALYELRRSTFTLADVVSITGLSAAAARNLVHKAQQRGLMTRLKPGLFNLVPFELGRATEHIDSPYLIARELVGSAPYFLSHGTALELHRMVMQPNFTVYVSCTRRVRPQTVGSYDFRFIHITAEQEFGVVKHWVDKERFVMISDMERTINRFDDLPEGPSVKVYDLREIVVEKLLALSDRARNEPRDLYDLWYLFGATDLRVAEMRAELDAKMALRQRVVAGMEQAIAAKEDRLRRLWTARLAHQRPAR